MRRIDAAFTLLEVMAAVAVVAIVFTQLARVANEGLRSEGISRRRLEASLIADRYLAEIESSLAAGLAPEIGESEAEEGLFLIVTSVESFDLLGAIPAAEPEATVPAAPELPAGLLTAEASPIRSIRIDVRWEEGVDELQVSRQTYGIDPAALQAIADAESNSLPIPGAPPSS